MNNKKVIYLGSVEGFESSQNTLKDVATIIHVSADLDSVNREIVDAYAIIDASMKVVFTDEMLTKAQNLSAISCATTGSDHISRGILNDRSIPVFTLKEDPEVLANLTPAAELSWALLMACARRLPSAVEHVKNGGWTREMFPGTMLNGKKLGLIGCGRIGGWMARYANAFGVEVIGVDPFLKEWPSSIKKTTLEDVMSQSDFISVHVHLSDETKGLVSKSLLETVKNGVVIINTSRGAIVDESALVEGLKSGRIAGVGIDVLSGEPDIADNPLFKYAKEHDNVLITPHCGGFSPDAVRVVCARAAEKIANILSK